MRDPGRPPLGALPSMCCSWAPKRASTVLPATPPTLSDFKSTLSPWWKQAATLLALAKCLRRLISLPTFPKIARTRRFIFRRRLRIVGLPL